MVFESHSQLFIIFMKIAFIVILFTFLLGTHSLRLFLIGGNTDQKAVLVYQQLAGSVPGRPPQSNCDQNWNTTKCPRIAVATSAAENSTAGDQAYSDDSQGMGYYTMFNLFGMSPKHLSVHRDNYKIDGNPATAQGAANLALLKQADIIYFNGGDQSRHIRTWLNDDGSENQLLSFIKERAFRNQVVLSGTSAGSMIWGKQTAGGGSSFGILYFKNSVGLAPKKITDAQVGGTGFQDTRNGTRGLQYEYNGGKMKAFGWIDWFPDTHFSARGRLGRLPAILVDTQLSLGAGIDQKTALFYQDGVGTVYGYNGVTICDMQNAVVKPQTFFTASGIRSHYLSAKDTYDFKMKKVVSSKPVITSPAYSGPTDSNDILASYEATLLETRQVDQRSLYNLGRTKRPSAFSAKETPTFQIKFSRDQTSRGYYSNKTYTVYNVILDYSFGANYLTSDIGE